jgi:4'-phosphopantetheinyl transferase
MLQSPSVTDKWQPCKGPRNLNPTEVHLWVTSLTLAPARLSYFESLLSREEKERACRFKKARDAQRYVGARGSLRSLLGGYLHVDPGQVRFAYGALGKPRLAEEIKLPSLNFSISHCDELALFGFAQKHRIGVDLECMRREIDIQDLARCFLRTSSASFVRCLRKNKRKRFIADGLARKLISKLVEKVFPIHWSKSKSVWQQTNLRES